MGFNRISTRERASRVTRPTANGRYVTIYSITGIRPEFLFRRKRRARLVTRVRLIDYYPPPFPTSTFRTRSSYTSIHIYARIPELLIVRSPYTGLWLSRYVRTGPSVAAGRSTGGRSAFLLSADDALKARG